MGSEVFGTISSSGEAILSSKCVSHVNSLLQIQQSETEKISLLDIDHPALEPEAKSTNTFPTSEPELATLDPTVTPIERPRLVRTETNEWASPAFIKRARVSYGSLFESGYDIFAEDDGTVQGKGRKRTRFSRESGRWRYSSRSPSPTVRGVDADMIEADLSELEEESKPSMTDEGCQTLDFEEDNTIDHSGSLSAQVSDSEQRNTVQNGTPSREVMTQTTRSRRGEAIVDKMLPPPRPDLILEVGAQTNSNNHQVLQLPHFPLDLILCHPMPCPWYLHSFRRHLNPSGDRNLRLPQTQKGSLVGLSILVLMSKRRLLQTTRLRQMIYMA
jgi:hypothetical protein